MLKEQKTLILSLIKWTILASLVGVITGVTTTLFLNLLDVSTREVQRYSYYFLMLPIVFMIISTINKRLPQDITGRSSEKLIESFHQNNGKINLLVIPVKLFSSIATLVFGGSAGKVGPSTQIGAGISTFIADLFKISPEDRKKIVVCGIGAGFASVFGTPLTGAIFAVEVLVIGRLLNELLFPALVSSMVSYQVASYLGIDYVKYHILIAQDDMMLYFLIGLSGIFFGLVGLLLIEMVRLGDSIFSRIKWPRELKAFLGGLFLILLIFTFGQSYIGSDTDMIHQLINSEGGTVPPYAFLLKILFTVATLSFGGSGGVLTPIFFIGSTSAAFLAPLLNIDLPILAAIGMVSLLAATANTPLCAIILSIELFGPNLLPYFALSIMISFIIAGHRSIYPTQVIGTTKSRSLKIPVDINLKEYLNKSKKTNE